jgi:predicted membrane-bound spermidine synthase
MNEKLAALWAKVVENKHIVIPVATAVVGGLIGAAITSTIISAQNDQTFFEEVVDQIDTISQE